ncbi:MAG: NAD(P)/FAD-dependent oxidoreductase [Verrucomicrobiota bacterium]|nr:NAD(P)/FAD-dependent oxidoreductase [Verrucomicrobiota bacterium]
MASDENKPAPPTFDVVIMGGALSGAATANLLLQEIPSLKILIIEKSTAFSRRVGEATVEVSTYFLMRSLGLTKFLNETQLNKNGLRFWFANEKTKSLEDCSEIGGRYLSRVPAYLVDRATLDEEVLRRAIELGAQLWRPAQVQKVELLSGGQQTVTVKYQERIEEIKSRWVVDASGVAAFLARQQGWWRANHDHPTTAVWSRWKNVKDFEDPFLAKKFPKWAGRCHGVRGTATNHLMGEGWWAWWIALKGGDVSIGITFDQRLVSFPESGSLGERLKTFLMQSPVARELLAEATWTEGDVHWRKNLPYYSTTYAGDGFSLVGDAAAFIDPFYSPGMDWISFTATTTKNLILAQQRGEMIAQKIEKHNRDFVRSYERWFEAIYRDKYEYFGEYDLIRPAFLMDLGFYYLGVAAQPFKRGEVGLTEPLFSTAPSVPFYHFMRFYNRRFAQMARVRRERHIPGRKNNDQQFMFGGYTFGKSSVIPIIKAIDDWILLELTEGWRSWFRKESTSHLDAEPISVPVQAVDSR